MGAVCSAGPSKAVDAAAASPMGAPKKSVDDPAPVAAAPAAAPAAPEAAGAAAAGAAVASPKKLVTLHYNDVYNLDEGKKEPVGGASRFAGMVYQQTDDDPLVLFSGDALNPSMASTFFKGKQMVPILNLLKTKVACVGNHDLDFGQGGEGGGGEGFKQGPSNSSRSIQNSALTCVC